MIASPLSEISNTAALIAAGELPRTLSTNGRADEVGKLTQSFMTDYLKETARVANSIAGGDLRVELKPQSERDVLGNTLAAMVQSLRRNATELAEGANVLASSASEILATTTQVASGATQTATAISETTTTVEEVKQTGHLSSQNANTLLTAPRRRRKLRGREEKPWRLRSRG